MKLPKITIVTPSYNQGRYLEQTILSVLGQQYPNLEYIIMDGGSTDNSVEIIRRYADKLAYWQSEPDRGQVDAVAKGFAISSGEILGWVNSDDLLLSNSLFSVAHKFPQDGKTIALTGRCVLIGPSGESLKVNVPSIRTNMMFHGHGLSQMATFWTRTAYDQVGGLDTTLHFSFDADLFVKLRRLGEIAIISEYLAAFRQHPRSKTSTISEVGLKEMQLIRKRYGKDSFSTISRMVVRVRLSRRIQNWLAWEREKMKVREILAATRRDSAVYRPSTSSGK